MTSRSILDAFTIFPFAIVLALALGEAFKSVTATGGVITWRSMYALASFLLLILPFYQGMNRYLLLTYGAQAALSRPHSVYLIIDGAAFMSMSALFFLMSRTLEIAAWRRFYWIVFALLVMDSAWGLTVQMHVDAKPAAVIMSWVILNIVTVLGIIALELVLGPSKMTHVPAAIATFGMLVRTIVDYWISWDFYFPILAPP